MLFLPCVTQGQEALQLIKAAIQLAPGNARYRHSLGVAHEAAQQWSSAADAFERAVEKCPSDVKVWTQTLGFDPALFKAVPQQP